MTLVYSANAPPLPPVWQIAHLGKTPAASVPGGMCVKVQHLGSWFRIWSSLREKEVDCPSLLLSWEEYRQLILRVLKDARPYIEADEDEDPPWRSLASNWVHYTDQPRNSNDPAALYTLAKPGEQEGITFRRDELEFFFDAIIHRIVVILERTPELADPHDMTFDVLDGRMAASFSGGLLAA